MYLSICLPIYIYLSISILYVHIYLYIDRYKDARTVRRDQRTMTPTRVVCAARAVAAAQRVARVNPIYIYMWIYMSLYR